MYRYIKTHVISVHFEVYTDIYWCIWKLASLLKILHLDHWKLDQQSVIVHYSYVWQKTLIIVDKIEVYNMKLIIHV